MIEYELTDEVIDNGRVRVRPRDVNALNLPTFTGEVRGVVDGQELPLTWNARTRMLGGEHLAEHLQFSAEPGWLLRLSPAPCGAVQISLIERRTSALRAPTSVGRPAATPTPPGAPTRRQRRRAATNRYRLRDRNEYEWTGSVGIRTASLDELMAHIEAGGWDSPELVELRLRGERLAAVDQFEHLLALDVIKADRMPHQAAVAHYVLSKMHSRGMLADEVGLGKTIEAGIILKELVLRGLAQRILILCPAPLRFQWQEEMREKFDEDFLVATKASDLPHRVPDRLIMTPLLAHHNVAYLAESPWDLLIADEAHKLSGERSKIAASVRRLIEDLRYVLFLTATPVQNDLFELYRLIQMLRPGSFSTKQEFRSRFMEGGDKRRPRDPAALRALISNVMVRTTRVQARLDRVKRRTRDIPIELHPAERELYQLCLYALRRVMTDAADVHRRRQLALRLTTSPTALSESALRMARTHRNPAARELLERIAHLAQDIDGSSRERAALQLVRKWVREHGRVIVFSQHTATITGLARFFEHAGVPVTTFHGDQSAEARLASIARFRAGDVRVLLSSDAGAEGQNLQFCNCVINYDLPWNPMRIEQRIGRVDRLGQPQPEVHVANLFAIGTVDEDVYRLLHDKLAMFELLFGQVTTILGELDDGAGATFEGRVIDALIRPDDDEMRRRLDAFGAQLEHARAEGDKAIRSQQSLSDWSSEAKPFAHRDGLRTGDELAPHVTRAPRSRAAEVQAWIRDYLVLLGAEISHEAESFVAAELPDELTEELGGFSTVHFAFSREGLDVHPEAELCAPGSEVFDLVLDSLRTRGDLVARMVVPPDLDTVAPTPARGLELVDRSYQQRALRGTATVRVQKGNGGEEIMEVLLGGTAPAGDRRPRRLLPQGERLAKTLPGTIRTVTTKAVQAHLAPVAADLAAEAERDVEERRSRTLENLEASLHEVETELMGTRRDPTLNQVRQSLRKQIARLSASAEADPVEVRAEVLALDLDLGCKINLIERWRNERGEKLKITRHVDEAGTVHPATGADGEPIEVLATCRQLHPIDASKVSTCASCDLDVCRACGPDLTVKACALCGRPVCTSCLSRRWCPECRAPTVLSPEDLGHLVYRLTLHGMTVGSIPVRDGGQRLLVAGRARRELVELSPTGEVESWTSFDGLEPLDRRLRMAFQRHLGAEPAIDVIDRTAIDELSSPAVLVDHQWTEVRWTVEGQEPEGFRSERNTRDEAINTVITRLTGGQESDLPTPTDPGLERAAVRALERLASSTAPGRGCCLEVTSRRKTVTVTAEGLSVAEHYGEEVALTLTPLEPGRGAHEPGGGWDPAPEILTCAVEGCRLQVLRSGRHVVAHLHAPDRSVHAIVRNEPSDATRLKVAGHLNLSGAAATGVIVDPADLVFVQIEGAELASRRVAPTWVPGPIGAETNPELVARTLALDVGEVPDAQGKNSWLARILNPVAVGHPEPATGDIAYEVAEEWTVGDHHRLLLTYLIPPGQTVGTVEAEDTGQRCSSLAVCATNHLVQAVERCTCCRTAICGVCPDVRALRNCAACERASCADCLDGQACRSCHDAAPIDPTLLGSAAEELCLHGLELRVSDLPEGRKLLQVTGRRRRELAVLDHQNRVLAWWSVSGRSPQGEQLSIELQRRSGTEVDADVVVNRLSSGAMRGAPLVDRVWSTLELVQLGGAPQHSLHQSWQLEGTGVDHPVEALASIAGRHLGRVPAQIDEERAEPLRRLLARAGLSNHDDLTRVELRLVEHRYRLAATGEGLEVTECHGREEQRRLERFRAATLEQADWSPEPDQVLRASADEVELTIAAVGRHCLALIAGLGDEPRWCTLRHEPDELARRLAGFALGQDHPVRVTTMVAPNTVRTVRIEDGEHLGRELRTVVRDDTGCEGVPADVAAGWLGAPLPRRPVGHSEPVLANALLGALDKSVPPSTVAVGYQVEDRWLVRGRLFTVISDLAPGDVVGAVEVEGNRRRLDVCRLCDEGHTALALEVCTGCERHICPTCAPLWTIHACDLCGQPTCRGCSKEGTCRSCRHPEPVPPGVISSLSDELCLATVSVWRAPMASGWRALLIGSPTRRELAVLGAAGELLDWWSISGLDSDVTAATLAAERALGRPVRLELSYEGADEARPDDQTFVDERWTELVLTANGQTTTSRHEHTDPSGGAQLVMSHFGHDNPRAPVPLQGPRARALGRILNRLVPESPLTRVQVHRRDGWRRITASLNGLVVEQCTGTEHSIDRESFRPVDVEQEPIEGWDPQPETAVRAALAGFELLAVRTGEHAAARVSIDGQVQWFSIIDCPDDLRRRRNGQILGLEGTPAVSSVARRHELRPIQILNAKRLDGEVAPVVHDAAAGAELAPAVVTSRLGGRQAEFPNTQPLPADLAWLHGLLTTLTSGVRAECQVSVGWHVSERWERRGEVVPVAYDLAPGEVNGALRSPAAGRDLSVGALCDEHHFATTTSSCWTCDTERCAACTLTVQRCATCGWDVCDACADASLAAPARTCALCRRLTPVKRKVVKDLGLRVPRLAKVALARAGGRRVARIEHRGRVAVYRSAPGGSWETIGSSTSSVDTR